MADDPKREDLPEAPRLPQRAAIYIAPDGTVHFGALFQGLVPVANALTSKNQNTTSNKNKNENQTGAPRTE